jgi:hypothetical protein
VSIYFKGQKCAAPENSFLSGNEIKHAKKKTGGTVTVPPERPCAEHDDDVLPVLTVTTFLGSRNGAGEIPVECSRFLEVSVKIVLFR